MISFENKKNITQGFVTSIAKEYAINNKPCTSNNSNIIWDTKEPGFGIALGKNNAAFFYKYRNKLNKCTTKTINKISDISVQEARSFIEEFKPNIRRTSVLQLMQQREASKHTVSDLCNHYFEKKQNVRESTHQQDLSRYNLWIKPYIGNIKLSDLTKEDIQDLQNRIKQQKRVSITQKGKKSYTKIIGGVGVAKRTIEMLSAILSFGVSEKWLEANPMLDGSFKKVQYEKKEIAFLEDDDYVTMGRILFYHQNEKAKQYVQICRLLALTGCRKSEILNLSWGIIDLKKQYFDFKHTKTKAQKRPFGIAVKTELEQIQPKSQDLLFPSNTKNSGHRLDARKAILNMFSNTKDVYGKNILQEYGSISMKKNKIGQHTFRHSFASMANQLGFSDIIISGMLGHKKGDITSVYAHNIEKCLVKACDKVSTKINKLIQKGFDLEKEKNDNYKGGEIND